MIFDFNTFIDKENEVQFEKGSKESQVIHHKRYKYHKKWQGKKFSTYWCANCKSSKSKCSSKIKVDCFGKVIKEEGSHDVECTIKNQDSRQALKQLRNDPNNNNPDSNGIDYTSFMRKKTDELALENLHLHPKEIWDLVSRQMNEIQPTWKGMTDFQVTTRVRNIRSKYKGSDLIRNIEESELARMKSSNKTFLQFNSTIVDDTKEQTSFERIMGFGNPYLFYYFSHAQHLFIDATFSVAPKPFYQCLVVMIYDDTLQIYIPILYILMTNKSKKMYRNALEWVFKLSQRRVNPKTITCDFELALINAIQGIFPYAKINGCLFHWKQAIRRKLISLKLSNEKEIVDIMMHQNSIDILTIVPVNEIKRKGIPFVKDNLKDAMNEDKDFQKMQSFWHYFDKFWMTSEKFINSWNISTYPGNKNLLKRTNNGLERYNRYMKSLFCSGTPSFAQFVNTMRAESEIQQKKVQDHMDRSVVKKNKIDENDGNFIYELPPCYAGWVPPSLIEN